MDALPSQNRESLGRFVRRMSRILTEAGIEDSLQESRQILSEALDLPLSRQYLMEADILQPEWAARAEEIFARRAAREPLSSILSAKSFYGRRFSLNEACLAPRPETEELVNAALEFADRAMREATKLRLAEWCCGSGAPGLSLLLELKKRRPGLNVHLALSDISVRALEAARLNAKNFGLTEDCSFEVCDLFPSGADSYDMILCNPPYIPSGDMRELMPEVKNYEPALCLDGGEDGLLFYRRLDQRAREFLCRPGALIMEHGIGQSEAVREIFRARQNAGEQIQVRRDLAGLERAAVLLTAEIEE